MSKIKKIDAIEILDSRGNPTVEVIVITENNCLGKSKIPSGASTGEKEALELRDNDKKRYSGKGVLKVVENVKGPLFEKVKGQSIFNQEEIDRLLIEIDGTENKSRFGANAILGISLAVADAASKEKKEPLYRYLASLTKKEPIILPIPMMNIINGGAHSDNLLDFQEFMIRPKGAPSFKEAVRFGSETFHALKKLLKEKRFSTSVGDEGGFAPNFSSNEEALAMIIEAIKKAGYRPADDISIALDPAASEFFDKKTGRYLEKKRKTGKSLTSIEQVNYLLSLVKDFPIDSIEDGLDENDWEGWKLLTEKSSNIQIVGDDIFATNPKILRRAIKQKIANAILIKPNQIGTLTETLATIKLAQQNNYGTVISHRSGDTEDTFIADLAVATQAGQIKTGSLSRSERTAKYNRLLEIEAELFPNVVT